MSAALVSHTIVDVICYLMLHFFHRIQRRRTHEQEDQYAQLISYAAAPLNHH